MNVTRYWYDTEFVEDGRTIDLLSIGIVCEDGREYYAVSADADYEAAARHPFVSKHVLPILGDTPKLPRTTIREQVSEFLRPNPGTQTELWAWYGAYDHVALAQLMGTMVDMPPHIPQWTNDLRQEQHRRGNPALPSQPQGLHNALEDARHLAYRHTILESL